MKLVAMLKNHVYTDLVARNIHQRACKLHSTKFFREINFLHFLHVYSVEENSESKDEDAKSVLTTVVDDDNDQVAQNAEDLEQKLDPEAEQEPLQEGEQPEDKPAEEEAPKAEDEAPEEAATASDEAGGQDEPAAPSE